jgi:hypothetical protein
MILTRAWRTRTAFARLGPGTNPDRSRLDEDAMMSNAFKLMGRRMCGWAWTAALRVLSSMVSNSADTEVCMGHTIGEVVSPMM